MSRRRRFTRVSPALMGGLVLSLALAPVAALGGNPWGPVAEGTYSPAPVPEGSVISFSHGLRFDPLLEEPDLAPELMLAEPGEGELTYYLVQGYAPLTPDFRQLLASHGAEPLRYHSHNAYVVRADVETAALLRELEEVRWVGFYHPGYRLSAELAAVPDEREEVVLLLFAGTDLAAAESELASLGAEIIGTSVTNWNRIIVAEIGGSQIASAAAIPGVDWIEPHLLMQADNNRCQWVIQTWTQDDRRIWDMGIKGEDQILTIHDSGLYMSHCMFNDPLVPISGDGDYPTHRKIIAYKLLQLGLFGDESGHGSHTTCTLAGDDQGEDARDGMSIHARVYFTDGGRGPSGIYVPDDLNTLYMVSYNGNAAGAARISSNSWGSGAGGYYSESAMEVDEFMWEHPDYLLFFSTGNDGPTPGTVHAPSTAKNVVSCGGTLNGTLANSIYNPTSRGPTDDGRMKPTICAPASLSSARYNTACSFWTMAGTSMATPALAGGAGLIREYLTDGWYPGGVPSLPDAITPSAALMKAMVVNSGDPNVVGGTFPDNNIGWGRMNLDDVLYFAGDDRKLLLYDEETGLGTFQFHTYHVEVTDNSIPLEVTLVWTDYPGTPGMGDQLVNDLDLTVYYGATIYRGNNYVDEESVEGGSYDRLNVEECVQRNTPELGIWTIRVAAATTPEGPQPYALVVTGGVAEAPTSVEPPADPSSRELRSLHAPNPVSTGTVIRYHLPRAGEVRLTVYDVTGRVVRTLVDSWQEAGDLSAVWDVRDGGGQRVSSGVYFYRLETPFGELAKKLVVTR